MTLRALAWYAGITWGAITLSFVLFYAAVEMFGGPRRPWRRCLGDLARNLPVVLFMAGLFWPIILVAGVYFIRRDLLLGRISSVSPFRRPPRPLSEKDWLRGRDAAQLLYRLNDRAGRRVHQLFACSCCRRVWHRVGEESCRRAVEVAERAAEGLAGAVELLEAAREVADAAALLAERGDLEEAAAARACQDCLTPDGAAAAARAALVDRRLRREQVEVLRDLVGDPFRPLRTRSFPPEVVELARARYDGDSALYPLLADALAELGEEAAAEHCRARAHVKGCHVLDWVLGLRGAGDHS